MWYWFFRGLFWVILKLFFKFQVDGVENMPQNTNFIVVANHTSFLDSVAVGCAVPKKIYWLVARELFNLSWLTWFLQKVETVPVGESSEKGIELLSRNRNIGLFPEGACSLDGKLREFHSGVALLAIKTGRPIIPCAVLGTFEALPRDAKWPKTRPIKVRIGKPIYLLKEFDRIIDEISLQVYKLSS